MVCVDESQIELKGNEFSPNSITLSFSLNFPESFCRDNEFDVECIGSYELEKQLHNTRVVTMTNRKRFEQEEYAAGTPIRDEAIIQWFPIPKTQT